MNHKIQVDTTLYKFYCQKCIYGCNRKNLFEQHKRTKKHNADATQCNANDKYKCTCGKTYRYIRNLNRHLQDCSHGGYNGSGNVVALSNDNAELKNMITTLITQNNNILSENKEMRGLVKEMIPKIGNTTINNKFNLQIFLNERCKDAINMTEFVDTLHLEMDDLDKTCQNGYISGIANIFVKGLKQLELHQRPIHCSDLKREVLYVKDNDTWERDNEEKTIKKAINAVAKKQVDKIKELEQHNPEWTSTENGTKEYIEMVRNVTNTGGDDVKSDNKIIRTIAKEVIIEKVV
jgi:hypothetical protein